MSSDQDQHKPSAKHTLEEVLRTLQDLVRNELADPAAQARPPTSSKSPAGHRIPATNKPGATATKQPDKTAVTTSETLDDPPVLTEVVVPGPTAAHSAAHRNDIKSAQRKPEQTTINWDDIPVLNEVVQAPAKTPPKDQTRLIETILSRVLAELDKAGQPLLDPVIIARLEKAVRETVKEFADK